MADYLFILCDNGAGHTRRGLSVVRELRKLSHNVTVLGDDRLCRRFGESCIPFRTHTSYQRYIDETPRTIHWHLELPDLSGYDHVVSDNLVEVLEIRPDAVLMGAFLWHQIAPNPGHSRRMADLVSRHRPAMLGTGMFASDELKSAVRYVDAGFFLLDPVVSSGSGDLLIGCGRSESNEAREEVSVAVRSGIFDQRVFDTVHLEPDLWSSDLPGWVRPASFTPEMYAGLGACVLRPGLGTITDCLSTGARLYAFGTDDNPELMHNAATIERRGFGSRHASFVQAYQAACAGHEAGAHGDAFPALPEDAFNGSTRAAFHLGDSLS